MAGRQQELLPAYLTVGEDRLKRKSVTARLKARLEQQGDLSFNYDRFDGETAAGDEVVNAANTMPFASEVRLVEVSHVEKMRKQDSEAIVEYLANPCPTTVMLLDGDKLAKNTRLYKAVASLGRSAVIECASMKEGELVGMTRKLAAGYGASFSEAAARKLVALLGTDTVAIDAEVKKIALAHVGSSPVDAAEVEALVVRKTELKPWDFTDALANRDLRKCLWVLPQLKSVTPYQLLPQSVNRIREIICAKSLSESGQTSALEAEISAFRGKKVSKWQVQNHVAWSRKWTAEELRGAIRLARGAELDMKSGKDPDEAFLEWVLAVVARG